MALGINDTVDSKNGWVEAIFLPQRRQNFLLLLLGSTARLFEVIFDGGGHDPFIVFYVFIRVDNAKHLLPEGSISGTAWALILLALVVLGVHGEATGGGSGGGLLLVVGLERIGMEGANREAQMCVRWKAAPTDRPNTPRPLSLAKTSWRDGGRPRLQYGDKTRRRPGPRPLGPADHTDRPTDRPTHRPTEHTHAHCLCRNVPTYRIELHSPASN